MKAGIIYRGYLRLLGLAAVLAGAVCAPAAADDFSVSVCSSLGSGPYQTGQAAGGYVYASPQSTPGAMPSAPW